jgi:hypothetical protein
MKSILNYGASILWAGIIVFGCAKVIENDPPVIISVAITPAIITPGSAVQVQVNASDNNGDIILYTYNPGSGTISGKGSLVSWLPPAAEGEYFLAIKASDNKGGVSYDTINVVVSEYITPTRVIGTATFPAGVQGDLTNARIGLYASVSEWKAKQPLRSEATSGGSFSIVNFTLNDLVPGTYFLDLWKDNDSNSAWTKDDFAGWYGSGTPANPQLQSFEVRRGQTTKVNIQMYILENKKQN